MAEDRDLLDELALVFSNYLLSLNNVKKLVVSALDYQTRKILPFSTAHVYG
ncbi:hypothetical protein [Leptospira borgpetersenii]|uniref:hypothetical protein n=1 Tax=Leptospira borgpetersenii TaxID=174 RepID=UPI000B017097|nr:hypothetical protein [Leptospira borgpetersenii]